MHKLTRFAVAALAVGALSGFAAAPASAAQITGPETARVTAVQPASAVNYTVRVYTGDVESAGTNSTIKVKLRGTEGTSGWLTLDNANDNFERGQLDIFSFTLSDLGTIRSVDVNFEVSGKKSGWYLDKITVTGENVTRTYAHYNWFLVNSTVNLPAA
jgi:hypothetical protein